MTTRTSIITALGACLALAAPAAADVRHATPTGQGTSCTAGNPCALERAVDHAKDGDEIVVHAGTHVVEDAGGTDPTALTNLTIRPAAGAGRPEIRGTMSACTLTVGAGSQIRGLDIRPLEDDAVALCASGRVTAESLAISGTSPDVAGLRLGNPQDAVIRNVSIYLPGSGARGIVGFGTGRSNDIDNVTVHAGAYALQLQGSFLGGFADVRASYLQGNDDDIHVLCNNSAVTARLAHSAYDSVKEDGPGCDVEVGAGNSTTQGAALSLDDGVLRPAASSTLLERAPAAAATAETDVDGDPRVLGSFVDVGADERPVPPGVVSSAAHDVTPQSARLSSFTRARGADVTAVFEYGPTASYGETVEATKSAAQQRRVVLGLTPFAADVDGLTPGTTYHFRIKVTNEYGQVTEGEDGTFTTPDLAVVPTGGETTGGETTGGGAAGGPGGSAPQADRTAPACTVKLRRARRRGRAILSGRCSEASVLRVAVRGKRVAELRVKAGTFKRTVRIGVLRPGRRAVRVVARDLLGNAAPAARLALPKRRA